MIISAWTDTETFDLKLLLIISDLKSPKYTISINEAGVNISKYGLELVPMAPVELM